MVLTYRKIAQIVQPYAEIIYRVSTRMRASGNTFYANYLTSHFRATFSTIIPTPEKPPTGEMTDLSSVRLSKIRRFNLRTAVTAAAPADDDQQNTSDATSSGESVTLSEFRQAFDVCPLRSLDTASGSGKISQLALTSIYRLAYRGNQHHTWNEFSPKEEPEEPPPAQQPEGKGLDKGKGLDLTPWSPPQPAASSDTNGEQSSGFEDPFHPFHVSKHAAPTPPVQPPPPPPVQPPPPPPKKAHTTGIRRNALPRDRLAPIQEETSASTSAVGPSSK